MNKVAGNRPEINPLLAPVEACLAECLAANPLGGELREGDLLVWLRQQGWVEASLAEAALYKVHFLMRNALYRLVPEYPAFQWRLDAFGVRWRAGEGADRSGLVAGSDAALGSYYQDWSNFDLSDASVQQLLNSFWHRYAGFTAESELAPALATLGLTALPEKLDLLKQHYRRRVAKVHPDKAGEAADAAEAQRLNAAYATLKLVLKAKAL